MEPGVDRSKEIRKKETPPKQIKEKKSPQPGVMVTLGGREFKIKPLVIKDSREWRKGLFKLITNLVKYSETSTKPENFKESLSHVMIEMDDATLKLFFSYAKDLNREEIESIATDAELAKALGEIIKVALPLGQTLPQAMEKMTK